jgi:transcriptional regulator NrdR family protein
MSIKRCGVCGSHTNHLRHASELVLKEGTAGWVRRSLICAKCSRRFVTGERQVDKEGAE